MSIIQGVLNEEIQRLEHIVQIYTDMLSKLPRGTIFIRKIKNGNFVYRKRKENKLVVSEYLGPLYKDEVQKEIERSKEYKRIYTNRQIATKELVKLKKAIKVYD